LGQLLETFVRQMVAQSVRDAHALDETARLSDFKQVIGFFEAARVPPVLSHGHESNVFGADSNVVARHTLQRPKY